MRYRSNFGDSIAQAGRAIGNAFTQLPAAQKADAEYQAEQQEKQNTFNVANEYLKEIGREIRPPNAGESSQTYLMFAANQIDNAINSAEGLDRQIIQDKLYNVAGRLGVKDHVQGSYDIQSTRNSFGVPQHEEYDNERTAFREEQQGRFGLSQSDPMANIGLQQSEDSLNMMQSAGQSVNYPQAPQNQFRQQIPTSLSQVDQDILGGMANALSVSAQRLGKGITLSEFNKEYNSFLDTKSKLLKTMDDERKSSEIDALKHQRTLLSQGVLSGRTISDSSGNVLDSVNVDDATHRPEQHSIGTGETEAEIANRNMRLLQFNNQRRNGSSSAPKPPKSELAAEREKLEAKYAPMFANSRDRGGIDELNFAEELTFYRVAERIQNRAGGVEQISDADAKANARDRLTVLKTLRSIYATQLTLKGRKNIIVSPNVNQKGHTLSAFQSDQIIASLSPKQQSEIRMLLEDRSLVEAISALEQNVGLRPLSTKQLYNNYGSGVTGKKVK